MRETYSLDQLRPKERATVVSLDMEAEIAQRLIQLGLTPGVLVTCLRRAPAGDPTAYRFQGVTVALRREDARQIQVEDGIHGAE